jgi:hypothetical protein
MFLAITKFVPENGDCAQSFCDTLGGHLKSWEQLGTSENIVSSNFQQKPSVFYEETTMRLQGKIGADG